MRCVWCDSEYTFSGGERMTFDDILARLEDFGSNLVEVTGGEPLAQKNVFDFISTLCNRNYTVLIETGGYVSTESVDSRAHLILDVKCPGSGEAARNHWPNLDRLRRDRDEVKFVIAGMADWDFAKGIISKYELETRCREILISPVHGIENLAELAEAVASSGLKVRLNLQLHKYIWGADVHGV